MRMFKWFYRKDTKIRIDIDSNLGTCAPIYPLSFDCGNQETAELLVQHFNGKLEKYKTDIAKDPIYYLEPYQITAIKRKLNNWDSRKGCWK